MRAALAQSLGCALVLVVFLVGTGSAAAKGRGLLVLGETLHSNSLAPIVTFANGDTIHMGRLLTHGATAVYGDGDILVHDLAGHTTSVAETTLPARAIGSPVEGSAQTLIELFTEPGVVVLFETRAAGPADPADAHVYYVHRPYRASADYYPDLAFRVPEPGVLLGLACGVGLLVSLARRRG